MHLRVLQSSVDPRFTFRKIKDRIRYLSAVMSKLPITIDYKFKQVKYYVKSSGKKNDNNFTNLLLKDNII